MSDGIARFRDFTGSEARIQFKIRDDVFTAKDDIPLSLMGGLAKIGESLEGGNSDAILRLFEQLLEAESYQRFHAAVQGDGPTVIGLSRIKEIIPWLLEVYGLRPTEASSGSSTTLSESGANSTDGPLLAESTS